MTQPLARPLDRRMDPPVGAHSALRRIARARRQLLLYALIGALALITDLSIFTTLTLGGGWPPLAAHSVSVPVAAALSFGLNATVNFRQTDRLFARMVSFALVAATGYAIGASVIWLIAGVFGGPGLLAKLLSLPLVFALQYRLNSRVTFQPKGSRS